MLSEISKTFLTISMDDIRKEIASINQNVVPIIKERDVLNQQIQALQGRVSDLEKSLLEIDTDIKGG